MKYMRTALMISLIGIALVSGCQSNMRQNIPITAKQGSSDTKKRSSGSTVTQSAESMKRAGNTAPKRNSITKDGIWHTWHSDSPQIEKVTFGEHTYKKYTVNHNGSCGFYSLIPIILEQLLPNDWCSWMKGIRERYFDPVTRLAADEKAFRQDDRYRLVAPNPDLAPIEFYNKAYDLLENLSKAKAPYKLSYEGEEITTLVNFLRQAVLMGILSRSDKTHEANLDHIALTIDNKKNWWLTGLSLSSLCIFNLHVVLHNSDEHTTSYFTDGQEQQNIKLETLPKVILYYHDRAYFDYLVWE